MSNEPEQLTENDVISAPNVFRERMFVIEDVYQAVRSNGMGIVSYEEGLKCDVLRPGMQWRKGKIKAEIVLRFYPDIDELDELEKVISEEA